MCDEGLRLRKLQVEFFSQEDFELLLDFYQFCFWTDETDEPVIGVATIPQASEIGVVRFD